MGPTVQTAECSASQGPRAQDARLWPHCVPGAVQQPFASFPATPFLCVFEQANRPPAKLNLLTCQVKTNPEEKKCFDLISREAPSA